MVRQFNIIYEQVVGAALEFAGQHEGDITIASRSLLNALLAAVGQVRDMGAEVEVHAAEFERRFGALLGVEPTDLVARLFAGLGPDEAMIAAVTAVKGAGVPTGMINTFEEWLDHPIARQSRIIADVAGVEEAKEEVGEGHGRGSLGLEHVGGPGDLDLAGVLRAGRASHHGAHILDVLGIAADVDGRR